MSKTKPHPKIRYDGNAAQTSEAASKHLRIVLDFSLDLTLLRKQKRALIGIYEGATVSYEQEDAAEGLLNLIDFIQDSILEQGLATEEQVFPRLSKQSAS
ncbi:MAG: hypothetical protein BGO25_03065 [Acidobacteriales bacterium 59-55]|nr:hypothetical protein [Terriglobales bacterium]OJV40143.1 MAG: hypothetical protein BGO25_03065 [Acidobacteriales bacterium 59-55]